MLYKRCLTKKVPKPFASVTRQNQKVARRLLTLREEEEEEAFVALSLV